MGTTSKYTVYRSSCRHASICKDTQVWFKILERFSLGARRATQFDRMPCYPCLPLIPTLEVSSPSHPLLGPHASSVSTIPYPPQCCLEGQAGRACCAPVRCVHPRGTCMRRVDMQGSHVSVLIFGRMHARAVGLKRACPATSMPEPAGLSRDGCL